MIKLSQVQAFASSQISADTQLAVFGVPLSFSLHDSDETARAAINQRLRTTGVCIEVGSPIAEKSGSTIGQKVCKAMAIVNIYAAEKVGGTHTPKDVSLMESIVAAMLDANAPGVQVVEFSGNDAYLTEHGYVLHVISFTMPVIIGR